MKKTIVLTILLTATIWLAGCTTAKFNYQFAQTDPNLTAARISADYTTVGGKEYQGLELEAPNDWGLKVDKSNQQEVEVETLASKVAELVGAALVEK